MSTGPIIAVVGPSGVGKDTVMQALVDTDPGLVLVRRVITRAADAGGECFTAVSQEEFDRRLAAGDFALSWTAHGLKYGVPGSIRSEIEAGRVPVVNLSRRVLPEAQDRFAGLVVVALTAEPDVLARRLMARGRETEQDVQARLERAALPLPGGLKRVHVVDNSGPLDQTLSVLLNVLAAARG